MNLTSERLPKRSEIELVRPGAARLAMQGPVGVSNLVRRKQPVFALGRNEVREPALRILAADDAVDDHMRDVNPLRAELPRQAWATARKAALAEARQERGGRARKEAVADLKRRDHGVVADIVGDEVQSSPLTDFVQQGGYVRFARCVGYDRFSAAAGVP